MLLPRTSVRSALLILILLLFILLQTPGRCHAAARHRDSAPRAEARRGLYSLAQLVRRYRRGPVGFSGHEAAGEKRPNHEARLSDPKHKEKFITHMTGPLFFKPQCRKQFHRLYNHTRDCTVPTFYKRCARLLTQLAKSPRCAER